MDLGRAYNMAGFRNKEPSTKILAFKGFNSHIVRATMKALSRTTFIVDFEKAQDKVNGQRAEPRQD